MNHTPGVLWVKEDVTLGSQLPLLAFKVLKSFQETALTLQAVLYKLRTLSNSQKFLDIVHVLRG